MTHPCVMSYDAGFAVIGQTCPIFDLDKLLNIGHVWPIIGHV